MAMSRRACKTCEWFATADREEDYGICTYTRRYNFHTSPLIDVRDAAYLIRWNEDYCSDWKPMEEDKR